ncbi:GbsR/MarR family transcriptional regulator [Streptomyces sp. NPDC091292]|uniref:GbsR/MarR family transcriptional regulator n=1 Tax=Streptomyces sp. NPDC091292 TaxID=3365991 RepID=UPI003806F826
MIEQRGDGSAGAGGAGGPAAEGVSADGVPGVDEAGVEQEARVSRFVEHFAAQMVEAGMARMPARVFAALLASESGALTSAELGERLQVSPAGVSGAVRYLAQQHMVSREREPGSRRERYRVHSDQWYEALTNRDSILKRWSDALAEGVRTLGADTAAGARLAETRAFFDFVEVELSTMMDRWHAHRVTLGFGTPPPA